MMKVLKTTFPTMYLDIWYFFSFGGTIQDLVQGEQVGEKHQEWWAGEHGVGTTRDPWPITQP